MLILVLNQDCGRKPTRDVHPAGHTSLFSLSFHLKAVSEFKYQEVRRAVEGNSQQVLKPQFHPFLNSSASCSTFDVSRLKSVKLRFVRVFLTFSSFLISCCSPALPERIMWPTRVFSLFQIYQNQLCTQGKKSHSSWWFDYVILSDVALHLGDYTFPALLGLAASIIWSLFWFLGLNANVLNCRLWMKLSLFSFFCSDGLFWSETALSYLSGPRASEWVCFLSSHQPERWTCGV